MKRFVRLLVLLAVVGALLLLNLVTFKIGIGTAHACGKSIVNFSEVQFSNGGNQPVDGHFALWYDSCAGNNYTEVVITSGSDTNLGVQVCRNSGPDGGAQCSSETFCYPKTTCDSGTVHSPRNTAYAILYTSATILTGSSF